MKKLTAILCLTIAMILGSVGMSWSADFQKRVSAAQSGDYATALRKWEPLAEQGHAGARKGLNMFRNVDVPVFGIIENMSYFTCPHCGERSKIFAHGGARSETGRLGCDFLGEIPLDIDFRTTSDGGEPIVVSQPDGEHAKSYKAIAEEVASKISATLAQREVDAPRIVVQ